MSSRSETQVSCDSVLETPISSVAIDINDGIEGVRDEAVFGTKWDGTEVFQSEYYLYDDEFAEDVFIFTSLETIRYQKIYSGHGKEFYFNIRKGNLEFETTCMRYLAWISVCKGRKIRLSFEEKGDFVLNKVIMSKHPWWV